MYNMNKLYIACSTVAVCKPFCILLFCHMDFPRLVEIVAHFSFRELTEVY